MTNEKKSILKPSRRDVMKYAGAFALSTPFASRAWAQVTEINMLAWHAIFVLLHFEHHLRIVFDNIQMIVYSMHGTYICVLGQMFIKVDLVVTFLFIDSKSYHPRCR